MAFLFLLDYGVLSELMNTWRENINFVLIEPEESGNIGAAARALSAMGFPRLSLVKSADDITEEAAWLAHNGLDVLTSATCYDTFNQAIVDATLVVGISRRKGKRRGAFLNIEDAVARIIESSRTQNVSVVFGREQRGLFNDETEECAYLTSIPAGGEHPSLNLSHAVQVVAYELHKAGLAAKYEQLPKEQLPDDPLSTHGQQEHLFTRFMEILEALNYTKRGDREVGRRIRASLKHFLGRAGITASETLMFEGICSRILARLKGVS